MFPKLKYETICPHCGHDNGLVDETTAQSIVVCIKCKESFYPEPIICDDPELGGMAGVIPKGGSKKY